MLDFILLLFVLSLVNEAVVELVIKSEIFLPIRKFIFGLGTWFQKLFSCGYCFSFWTALFLVNAVPETVLPLSSWSLVNWFFTLFLIQRLSNIIHNTIDKWTDKYYSLAHVNSEKQDT